MSAHTPATLAAWTLAAMVEAELIGAEAATGHSFAAARRPLNRWERAATTRFGDIAAHVKNATEASRPLIGKLLGAGTEAVVNHLFPLGADAVAAATAAELLAAGRAVVEAAEAVLTPAIAEVTDTLRAAHRFGAQTVLDELARQGQTIDGWGLPTAPATIEALAANIATHPLIRQLEIAAGYVADPFRTLGMQVTRAEIEALLGATSTAGPVDVLHQGVQTVLGMGRIDVIDAAGAERFVRAYSSEILDANTCSACAGVDGTAYDTLAAARADYPTGGGYRACAGGARCRGLLVFLLRALAEGLEGAPG